MEHVDLESLDPEERLNFLLLFIAQNLRSCDLTDDFVLIVRAAPTHPERKGWGVLSTITDAEEINKLLLKLGKKPGDFVEERGISTTDFLKRGH